MIGHLAVALLHGIVATIAHTWWLFAILLGAKFGPRLARGFLMRRGGIQ